MAVKKRIWIPLATIVLLGAVFCATWFYVPDYAERRFTEKLEQVGIKTDSIEFRIEGLSRPVVRNLSLRVSGINLVAESIEFGSFFDGYGEDKPLKVTVHGLWAGINAQIPEGILSVNNAILALPDKESFRSPIPVEIRFEEGEVLYENHGRQIEGLVDGKLFIENTVVTWEVEVDVRDHPIKGRGFFDWDSGLSDIAGEMDLSHELGQAIWDILNEDPLFTWTAGRLQTAFHFEAEAFRYQTGQVHAIISEAGIGLDSLDILGSDHVASIIWTPGYTTVDFAGSGKLSRLLEAPFDWAGSLSVEPGPVIEFQLDEASISPDYTFGKFELTQDSAKQTPLEISLLGKEEGLDFQILGLDMLFGGELGEQLTSSTLDLMINGHWKNQMIIDSSIDLWLRDGIFMTPMFQAEVGEAILNAEVTEQLLSDNLIPRLLGAPQDFIRYANLSETNLFRYAEQIGERVEVDWVPGNESPLKVTGDFAVIGPTELVIKPDSGSTTQLSTGTLYVDPGEFIFDYELKSKNLNTGLQARLNFSNYPIQDYPNMADWFTGEFDITGFLSGQADFELTPEALIPRLKFDVKDILYASGNLVMDSGSYAGVIESIEPFQLKTNEPFTASMVQVNGWPITDLHAEIEISNRINISNTTFAALGGFIELSDISMGTEDLFIESEIGVSNIQTDEVLQLIPKVIGMAEGTISGVVPFQWDLKENKFSLGRGHLHSPEGELGLMNLKIFRPEKDQNLLEDDDRYSMIDEALSNLQDSSLDIDILPPNALNDDTRVRLNIKGFVDSRIVKAPVDVVRYYSLPIDSFSLTMDQVRQDLPGIKTSVE